MQGLFLNMIETLKEFGIKELQPRIDVNSEEKQCDIR